MHVRVVLKIFVDLKNCDLIFIGELKILNTITYQKKKKIKHNLMTEFLSLVTFFFFFFFFFL
jgi:hypothetical protein